LIVFDISGSMEEQVKLKEGGNASSIKL